MQILIADDDSTSRTLLGATLKKMGHTFTAAQNGDEAWELLQKHEFEVLLSDWMMPGRDGLELCRLVRHGIDSKYTYVILLTAYGGKANYLGAMDSGADDFITKPFEADQLEARLQIAQRTLNLHESLRILARHDGLTGLWNRAAILEYLNGELQGMGRGARNVAVLLADIDDVTNLNATYGVATGDALLRETARRMRRALGPGDRIGRFSGDTFLIVTSGGDASTAIHETAHRLRASVSEEPVPVDGQDHVASCSLGIAIAPTGERISSDTLLQSAATTLRRERAHRSQRGGIEPTLELTSVLLNGH